MFYQNFVTACEKNNTTPSAVRKELKIPQPTMHSWKIDGATPRPATIEKIAGYLNVEPSQLTEEKPGKKQKPDDKKPTEPKSILIAAFESLNNRGQKVAVSRLKELNQIHRYTA